MEIKPRLEPSANSFEIILAYFPQLTIKQKQQFQQMDELYRFWNQQVNVISRKDIDQLYVRHVLHSLGVGKVLSFLPGERVLDVGTGGGFPGIPLAVLFPEASFFLVDSIGKKINVVKEVVKALRLENVQAICTRAEHLREKYNFIISRAVTSLKSFYPLTKGKFLKNSFNQLENGALCLKGGDLAAEIKKSHLKKVVIFPLNAYFELDFFQTKHILYFPNQ